MKFTRMVVAALLATGFASTGQAADWPEKPIKAVIGFAPGGPSDIAFKMMQDELSKHLGQPVIPEYRPGANGNLSLVAAASAPPDGYTILWTNAATIAVNQYLYKDLKVDPAKAFAPVAQLTDSPLVVVVPKDSPYKTMQDLIAAIKADSQATLTYGSPGFGSSAHTAASSLALALNAKLTHVPYKGSAPALQDLIAGRLTFMIDSRSSSLPYIKDGMLRPLAVSGTARVKDLPDLPTIAESGVPGFKVTTWQAVVVPAGTPKPIIDKLAKAIETTAAMPVVQERFERIATPLVSSSPEAFAKFWAEHRETTRDLVERANLKLE
ncbi:exported protein [Achromobacter denitrificans]|uniref:Bug family tripartite tricarboxylate transporter substrate binding protein n=1 Tax=Achromobacter denitrificans TaxID=32002 RepID=UPI00166F0C60|nr:tripartite tricarboxylate transporter substrate binding protein [Achromobacter denitrificans]GFN28481.1 exported protein [Achromobacter denitrificans]